VFTFLPLNKDRDRLDKLIESDIYVYQQQESICGYGAIYNGEIRTLFVRPESRGQGIGKILLEFLL